MISYQWDAQQRMVLLKEKLEKAGITVWIDLEKMGRLKKKVILSAFCNSTRPQHNLQMFADHCGPRQTMAWGTINQGLIQPQGELYPI